MISRNWFVLAVLALSCVACNLTYIDSPSPNPWDYWVKEGANSNQIKQAYFRCGFDDATWNVEMEIMVEECMFKEGFVFKDHPYFEFCRERNPEFRKKDLPACQFLKK